MKITRLDFLTIVAGLFGVPSLASGKKPQPPPSPQKPKVWAWHRGWLTGCPFSEENGFIVLGCLGEDSNVVWGANFPVPETWRPRRLSVSDYNNHFRRREHCGGYLEFSFTHPIVMDALGFARK